MSGARGAVDVRMLACGAALLAVTTTLGCSVNSHAEDTGRGESGIVGGSVEPGYAAVGVLKIFPSGRCTAALVAPHVLLSAKHCIRNAESPGDVEFWLGAQGETFAASATKFFYTGDFDEPADNGNDFVAIALDQAVPRTPIAYRKTPLDLTQEGSRVFLVGYGLTAFEGADFGVKRSGWTTLDTLEPFTFRTRREPGQAVTCQGDSGGPVLLNGEIVGVNTSGFDECTSRSRKTRVDQHQELIARAIGWPIGPGSATDDSCKYALDGACDEPDLCAAGTDTTDCAR